MIKQASIEQLIDVCLLAKKGFEQHDQYNRYPVNDGKMAMAIKNLIQSDTGIVLVSFSGEKIVGTIIGEVLDLQYCDAKFSTDYGFYIDSDYQNKSHGYKLFSKFIEVSKQLGANEIRSGCTTGGDSQVIEKLLSHFDFSRRGQLYDLCL